MRVLILMILIGLVYSFKIIRPKTGIKPVKVIDNYIHEIYPLIDIKTLEISEKLLYLGVGRAISDVFCAICTLTVPSYNKYLIFYAIIIWISTALSSVLNDYIYLGTTLTLVIILLNTGDLLNNIKPE
jgi:hypothetical protein